MRRQLVPALRMTIALVLLLGIAYPIAMTGAAQALFSSKANGSFVKQGNVTVGSSLIGQAFTSPKYFHPRPSYAGNGYDATLSGASNLGPSNPKLLGAVADAAKAYRSENQMAPDAPVPVDAVTGSNSGLDPDISVANALDQAARVAQTRGMTVDAVKAMIDAHTQSRPLGILGEKAVNVLELNLALDGAH